MTSLLDGKVDLAFATIDNVVAYQEGQGEAKIPDDPDLFAFMGGDGGFFSLVASPAVKSVTDLKGRTVSVDAMTTGLAFVVRELIVRGGVAEADVNFVRAGGTANRYRDLVAGKHDATLLRTPFELLAESRGYHRLATAETLGAYQGTVGIARRSFAREHEAALVGFLRAYKAATDWLYEPANREIAEAMLVANIRDMTPALAKQSYELLLADKGGLSRDLALDPAGIRTVLRLRSKFATPQKDAVRPDAATSICRTTTRRSASGPGSGTGADSAMAKEACPRADDRPARRHRSASPLGPAAAGAGPHAGRFRGARQLPAAARLSACAHARGARGVGTGCAAVLRPAQHPLHDEHGDRRMGARQADPLFAADRQRRSRTSGTSGRRRSITGCTRRGCTTITAAPDCSACAARRAATSRSFATPHARSRRILDAEGVADLPLGLDVVEPPMLFELQKQGIEVRDGQQTLLQAREVKNIDELTLLNMAAAMVDGVYRTSPRR